jgi:hypothetical protein
MMGGHAYLLSGYRDDTKLFKVTNSWGAGWGQQGHAWLRFNDLDVLFQNRGECVTATELLYVPPSKMVVEIEPNDIEEPLEPSEDYVNIEDEA